MCHFYNSREELIEGLIPYFEAGLLSNELCIWVASHPLPASDIWAEVGKSEALERGVSSGQLRVLDAIDWYGAPGALKSADDLIDVLFIEYERALAEGFQGLRTNGNASFVLQHDWAYFMEYELKLHQQLQNRQIVACCSYYRQQCKPVDMLEVVHRHHGALDRSDEQWQLVLASEAGKLIA
jgi:hypothetical protein